MSFAKSESLQEFLTCLKDFVQFIEINIPEMEKQKVNVLKIKLETATELAPEKLCETFMNKLKPFSVAICKKDEQVVLKNFRDLPLLKHFELEAIWPQISKDIKDEFWTRLSTLFVLSTVAQEQSGKIPSGTVLPSGAEIDMSQLTQQISTAMPTIMNMLGPLFSNMMVEQAPVQNSTPSRTNQQRERLRKKVLKKNQLNNLI